MNINDDYRIKSETLNVVLEERYFAEIKDDDGNVIKTEPKWKTVGYYPTPKSALKDLVNYKVMSTGMTNFEEIVSAIEDLRNDIEQLAI